MLSLFNTTACKITSCFWKYLPNIKNQFWGDCKLQWTGTKDHSKSNRPDRAVYHAISIINPLMPKRYFCTSILFVVFKKKICTRSQHWPCKPLGPRAYNSDCQNLLFPLQVKPVKVSLSYLWIFIFCTVGTNGLINVRIYSQSLYQCKLYMHDYCLRSGYSGSPSRCLPVTHAPPLWSVDV